nr:MAG TPA: hypothetical protein [Caudoviricetes sp.]
MIKKGRVFLPRWGVTPSPSVLQGFTPSLYIFSRGK